jgi:citrate lyase beta subunit
MTINPRPRRSVLYLPANRDSAIARARTLACDCVILDLEDAVQPDAKPAARAAAVAAAQAGGWGRRELLLRVNGMTSAHAMADFGAAAGAGFDAIVVPKVESVAEAQAAVAAAAGLPVWAMIRSTLRARGMTSMMVAEGRIRPALYRLRRRSPLT